MPKASTVNKKIHLSTSISEAVKLEVAEIKEKANMLLFCGRYATNLNPVLLCFTDNVINRPIDLRLFNTDRLFTIQ